METEMLLKYGWLGRNHWWLTSKYSILNDLLERFYNGSCPGRMLDIGCGSGIFLSYMKKITNNIFGIDLNYEIVNILSKHNQNIKVTVADAVNLPFRANSFDLVTLVDVLEHIDNDTGLIVDIKTVLRPGGLLLISVPAYNTLYGKHDKLYGHKRRYNRKGLINIIKKAGLIVFRATYFQPAFVLPLWFKRKMLMGGSEYDDFLVLPRPLNIILDRFIRMEKHFLRRFNIPFGATLICLCQKA